MTTPKQSYHDYVKTVTQHTPGPWKAEGFIVSMAVPRGRDIAVTSGFHGTPRDLANARLIAAAPELLEALEAIADEFIGKLNDEEFRVLAFNKARTAIAKARGEM